MRYIETTLPHYTEMGHSSLNPYGEHDRGRKLIFNGFLGNHAFTFLVKDLPAWGMELASLTKQILYRLGYMTPFSR